MAKKTGKSDPYKRGFGDVKGGQRDERVEDKVDMLEVGPDFKLVRPVGGVWPYAQHWIAIQTDNKGILSIPRTVPNFDPKTEDVDETIDDPYLEMPNPLRTSSRYFVNVIDRKLQEEKPRKTTPPSKKEQKTGLKNGKSKSWTPMRVISVPPSCARKIKALMMMNKHRIKGKMKECEITDEKYGCDIYIKFDNSEQGAAKWDVQKSDASPLKNKEQEYLMWDLSNLMSPMSPAETKKDIKDLSKRDPGDAYEEENDVDDYLEDKKDKKKAKKKAAKVKAKAKEKAAQEKKEKALTAKDKAKKGKK